MNFFEQQDIARKKTGRLVALFIAAVLGIIAGLFGVIELVIAMVANNAVRRAPHGLYASASRSLHLDSTDHVLIFLAVTAVVLLIVFFGSYYKTAALRSGGGAGVAEMLGGRKLSPNSHDLLERKVLNVVEEMALAAGTPVPPVYLLDKEQGINAFAAGFSPSDAVIGITRGCAEKLSREQLQGVVAHEFSHIINGDMRLNIRLMGILYGILIIALVGWLAIRTLPYIRISGDRRGGGGAVLIAILMVGIAMVILGFIGQLFGSLIQAAVSRQREYLADASAVQFTRNPHGLGGALMTIAATSRGSAIANPNAHEASHLFFSQALHGFSSLFATHPPLADRIKRLLPDWDGDLAALKKKQAAAAAPTPPTDTPARRQQQARRMAGLIIGAGVLDSIGRPTERHVDHAGQLIATLPQPIRDAAREPYGARAVIYGLLLDRRDEVRDKQLRQLQQHADAGVVAETRRLLDPFGQLRPEARLALIDLALPALRSLTADQYRAFQANVDALIKADHRIDLFEWALRKILHHHLAAHFDTAARPPAALNSLVAASDDLALLLTFLARVGATEAQAIDQAFLAGTKALGMGGLKRVDPSTCTLDRLDGALDRLAGLAPRWKQRVLAAAAAAIAADQRITINEAELFRAVADVLGVPVPPVLPDSAD